MNAVQEIPLDAHSFNSDLLPRCRMLQDISWCDAGPVFTVL
jgi:hypothetical protein